MNKSGMNTEQRIIITGTNGFRKQRDEYPSLDPKLADMRAWYEDHISLSADVVLRTHPTFGYKEYILTNSKWNREQFQFQPLSLLLLETGHMGVAFEDGQPEESG